MPWKDFTIVRGTVVMFSVVLAACMLTACSPWYMAYDIASDEDLAKRSAIPELRKALNDSTPDVRMAAATVLGRIGPGARDALPDLRDMLDDDSYAVREASAGAMARIIGPDWVSEADRDMMVLVYINRLGSADWTVRVDAANQLAQMGPAGADAVSALVAALLEEINYSYYWQQQYNKVRRAAANALGEMRFAARAANPSLIKASRFQDTGVRLEAVRALGKIGPKSIITEIKTSEENLPFAFMNFPDAEITVIGALKSALQDPDAAVRGEAANALGVFGVYADKTVPNLVNALSDKDMNDRRKAAQVLGRFGPKTDAAVEALVAALDDADAGVRQAAATALGNVHPDDQERVLPAITSKLRDPDKKVRLAADRTIAGFHPDNMAEVVKSRMQKVVSPVHSPAPEEAEAAPVVATIRALRIHPTVDVLNIRRMPGLSSRCIGKLEHNETAEVTETLSKWLKISKRDGTVGFVFKAYTEIVPETENMMHPVN
ncbi:MAG: HEAT repeat domain-containing protein [Thermodesulfobacteriota bacterium]|nr:HEAT repeat domain-containing protein [Thermodesulfobacteriota bacterium]